MNLKDRVIVITGAAGGLGSAISQSLSAAGAHLALLDLHQDAVDAMADDLHADARGYVVDVADEESVRNTFDTIARDWGAVHGLVNNAGIVRDAFLVKARDGKVLDRMSMEDWHAVIDVNLTGAFLIAREAAAHMIESGSGGAIVNIASVSKAGNMGQSNYSAAKAGVAALAVVWAKELARHNIRVVSVSPGYANTQMVAGVKPGAMEKLLKMVPLGRLAAPEEIAHTVKYCLENDYLTGRDIAVDGGLRL